MTLEIKPVRTERKGTKCERLKMWGKIVAVAIIVFLGIASRQSNASEEIDVQKDVYLFLHGRTEGSLARAFRRVCLELRTHSRYPARSNCHSLFSARQFQDYHKRGILLDKIQDYTGGIDRWSEEETSL